MKALSMENAKNEAKERLDAYRKTKNYSDLEKAFEEDNTNSSILFEYLNYLSVKDKAKYSEELKKYKFFLDKDSCTKLGIKYINHQDDINHLIDLFQNIDCKDAIYIQEKLKKILEAYYPKEDKDILEQKCDKRINNLPLYDLQNDIFFFLTIKIEFGHHLHSLAIVDFSADDEDDKNAFIKCFKESISYLKIFSEILKYCLSKNDRILAFKLVCILDFKDYTEGIAKPLCRLNYFLGDLKLDDKRIRNLAGELYESLASCKENYPVNKYMEKYEKLFFEILENILNSNCIKQLILDLDEIHKDKNKVMQQEENYKYFIDYVKKNILFFPFFSDKVLGITATLNGKVLISTDYKILGLSIGEDQLYNFTVWIITLVHEVIGNFLKDYFYYLTKFTISEDRNSSEESSSECIEGGKIVEEKLFSKIGQICLNDILYILDYQNWNKNLDEFVKYFTSKKREEIINKGKLEDIPEISKECLNILSQFGINKSSLKSLKTKTFIRCKKSNAQTCIDLSQRICLTHLNRKKKQIKNKNNIKIDNEN